MLTKSLRGSLVLLLLLTLTFACSKNEEAGENATEQQATLPSGQVGYTVPDGWVEQQPENRMRLAQFALPGAEGKEDGELVVFHFPQTGGSVEANLNRWYEQFAQPDGSDSKSKAQVSKTMAKDLPVTTVYLTGTYLRPQAPMMMTGPKDELPNYAMWAAIVETTTGPWFFKATGPAETMAKWQESFDAFVQSLYVK